MNRLLGVDPGKRWVGLALTDSARTISRPLRVVDRQRESLGNHLRNIIESHDVGKIIVGYPTPLKIDQNERTRQVDEFIEHFIESLSIPHETISERYSTREASRLRRKKGQSGEGTDAEAAAMILQYYLESRQDSSEKMDIDFD